MSCIKRRDGLGGPPLCWPAGDVLVIVTRLRDCAPLPLLSAVMPYFTTAVVPQHRQRFAYAMLDSKIYIMGGANSSSYDALPLNT